MILTVYSVSGSFKIKYEVADNIYSIISCHLKEQGKPIINELRIVEDYFKEFSAQIWLEQDFFKEFDCFWHKFHLIPSKYPDISS